MACVRFVLLVVLIHLFVALAEEDDSFQFSMHGLEGTGSSSDQEDTSDDFQGADEGGNLIAVNPEQAVLLISDSVSNIRLPVMVDALRRKNISYDVVYVNSSSVQVDLISEAGHCRYRAILFSNNHIISRHIKGIFDEYQRNCRAKKVIVYTTPNPGTGVVLSHYGPTNHTGNITIGATAHTFLEGAGNSTIEISGVYCYPSNIVDASRAVPAIYIQYGDSTERFAAGAFISLFGGQRNLEIYVDSAPWTPHAVMLGNLIANWLSVRE